MSPRKVLELLFLMLIIIVVLVELFILWTALHTPYSAPGQSIVDIDRYYYGLCKVTFPCGND